MKDPRDHTKWTNVEIEQDAEGYIAAQKAEREDAQTAEKGRAERRAREDFVKAYTAAGGDPEQAEDAYKAQRGKQAAESVEASDEQARRVQQHETLRSV